MQYEESFQTTIWKRKPKKMLSVMDCIFISNQKWNKVDEFKKKRNLCWTQPNVSKHLNTHSLL